jgi:hypothetical protein
MPRNERTVDNSHSPLRAVGSYDEMVVAGRDESLASLDQRAVDGFPNGDSAHAMEAAGENRSEGFGQMLDDDDPWSMLGKGAEERRESLRTSHRRAHGNEPARCASAARDLLSTLTGVGFSNRGRRMPHRRLGSGTNGVDDRHKRVFHQLGRREPGLGDHFERALVESP